MYAAVQVKQSYQKLDGVGYFSFQHQGQFSLLLISQNLWPELQTFLVSHNSKSRYYYQYLFRSQNMAIFNTTEYGISIGTSNHKWNPKSLEIRTTSVEKTLEPLVMQVMLAVSACFLLLCLLFRFFLVFSYICLVYFSVY